MQFLIPSVLVLIGMTQPIGEEKVDPPKEQKFQLDNGLTVLLRPVQGAKDTALVVLFSIGGDQDRQGRSGTAHLIEHLYVTAAAGNERARTADELIQRYPKGWNAQTGDRYTVIATVFPGSDLEKELQEAAARMGDLRVTASDLTREKPRVLEELGNMFGRIPSLGASNLARELVRPTPRNGRKGGQPEHISLITLQETQDRWRRYYKPKNAILVLAGALDNITARKAVQDSFGGIASGEAAPPPAEAGKPKSGAIQEVPVEPLPSLKDSEICLAYAAPAPTSELYAPFLVLMGRLWTGAAKLENKPGRMPVRFAPLDDPEVVHIGSSVHKGESAKEAEQRLTTFVKDAIKPKLDPGEINRLKLQFGFFLGFADQPDSLLAGNPYGVAFSLGRRQQLGINSDKLKKTLEQITEKELRQAAQQVFDPEQHASAVVWIRPK
ncbi:MAG TPA: insulinase family protein [Gemmataceae bacterium]|jgi:zinc protease|nr:insulinase family protein [Gemmataceae bacterium]